MRMRYPRRVARSLENFSRTVYFSKSYGNIRAMPTIFCAPKLKHKKTKILDFLKVDFLPPNLKAWLRACRRGWRNGHFYRYGTYTAEEPASLFWCDAVMSLQFTDVHSSQAHVAKLASALFYCSSLLRNNNMATNLQRFTSSSDS